MTKPVTFVLIFAFFFSCAFMIYEQISYDAAGTTTIVVEAEDTLWDIAKELRSDSEQDLRNVVQEIQELNGLDNPTIYPGQELIVPRWSEQMLGMDNNSEDLRFNN